MPGRPARWMERSRCSCDIRRRTTLHVFDSSVRTEPLPQRLSSLLCAWHPNTPGQTYTQKRGCQRLSCASCMGKGTYDHTAEPCARCAAAAGAPRREVKGSGLFLPLAGQRTLESAVPGVVAAPGMRMKSNRRCDTRTTREKKDGSCRCWYRVQNVIQHLLRSLQPPLTYIPVSQGSVDQRGGCSQQGTRQPTKKQNEQETKRVRR